MRKHWISIALIAVSLVGLGVLSFNAVRSYFIEANTMLFVNECPSAQVLIDGQKVDFADGSRMIPPWERAYDVEVRLPGQVVRRRIYPWAPREPGAALEIDKDGRIVFHVRSSPL